MNFVYILILDAHKKYCAQNLTLVITLVTVNALAKIIELGSLNWPYIILRVDWGNQFFIDSAFSRNSVFDLLNKGFLNRTEVKIVT